MYPCLHSSGKFIYRCSIILMMCCGIVFWGGEAKGQNNYPCPINQTHDAEIDQCDTEVNEIHISGGFTAISYDFSGATKTPVPSLEDASGQRFNVGTTTVTYTYIDSEQETTCSFDVTVVDNQYPVVTRKEGVTLSLDSNGEAELKVSALVDEASDNCAVVDTVFIFGASAELKKYTFNCTDIGDQFVTLIVRDASGNETKDVVKVTIHDYVPDPKVVLSPANGEICSDGTVIINLENEHFDDVTTWKWKRTMPAEIFLLDHDTISHKEVISYQFSNNSNAVSSIAYEFTPTIYNKCVLPVVTISVIVNPHPILVRISPDTICNNLSVEIPVRTETEVSPNAKVIYRWEVDTPPDIANQPASDNGNIHYVNQSSFIQQELYNKSDTDQKVIYTVKPLLQLNGKECPSPNTPGDFTFKKNDTIIVMPTPVIIISATPDTICNQQSVYFKVNSKNHLRYSGLWESILTRETQDNTNININTLPTNPILQDYTFEQTIENNSPGGRTVNYTFSPQIKIAPGKYCYPHPPEDKKDTTVNIAVNPKIKDVNFSQYKDSLCYMDIIPEIHLSVNNENLFGTMRYKFGIVDPALVNVIDTADFKPREKFTGWDATIDKYATKNESDTVQTVTYYMIPFIEYKPSLRCRGDSVVRKILNAPQLKYDTIVSKYIGEYNISCNGFSNGSIDVKQVSGGWPEKGYSYQWKGNNDQWKDFTDRITGLKAGDYEIIVRDNVLKCETKKDIHLREPELLTISIDSIRNPNCQGLKGYILVSSLGGTEPYTYSWYAPGLFDPPLIIKDSSMDGLNSGKYKITVFDANECEATVPENESELYYVSKNTIDNARWIPDIYYSDDYHYGNDYHISCFGANDGRINVNLGRFASAYKWILNDTIIVKRDTIQPGDPWFGFNFQISDLSPGVYKLSIIDNVGCEFTTKDTQTIIEPPPISFHPEVQTYSNGFEIQCNGAADGRIEILDLKGAYGGKYYYIWTVLEGDPNIIIQDEEVYLQDFLTAGTYQLVISNPYNGSSNGVNVSGSCRDTSIYILNQPPKLEVTANIMDYHGYQFKCFDDHSGSISLSIPGGSNGDYSYSWSTENGSGLIQKDQDHQDGLSAGVYKVDIGYNDGVCFQTEEYPLLLSPERLQNDSIISQIKCYGDNDAAIQINISGGVPNYTYQWSSLSDVAITNPNEKDQSNLAPGIYELLVKDLNNCEKKEIYELIEPDQLILTFLKEDMSCDPGNDGTIEVVPSGGTPGYIYSWDNGHTSYEISGLPEGTYTVTVTDANHCTEISSANIQIPPSLTVTAIPDTIGKDYHIDCYGNNSGKISLTIENGRGGYTYQWSSGDTTEAIDHATAGTYSVIVTDKFNCIGSASAIIKQPTRMWGQFAVTDVTCFGGNNGVLQALVGGGVTDEDTPYLYQWSNGITDAARIDRLTAGEYKVKITDNHGCQLDTMMMITQPLPLEINFTISDAFCLETYDGEIMAKVSGATPPYMKYEWTNMNGVIPSSAIQGTGTNSASIIGLPSGIYLLEVTDAANCNFFSKNVEINYSSEECLRIPNAFSPNDDGFNDTWEITVGDAGSFIRSPLYQMYPEAIVEVWSTNWGLLLYRSQKGYPEPWDGKFNGKYLPVNSYQYIIRLNNAIKPITGNVTVIR